MKVNRIIFFLLLASAGAACSDRETSAGGGLMDMQFDITRAGGNYAAGQTFGFVGYLDTDEPEGSNYGWGTYYYDPSLRALVPGKTNENGNASGGFDGSYGMRLREGNGYQLYMHTPGLALENSGNGSLRIKYNRGVPLAVTTTPMVLDVDGVSSSSYKVYDISPLADKVRMREMISKFSFQFIRGESTYFYIRDVLLHHLGTHAYYHPKLEINTIQGQEGSYERIATDYDASAPAGGIVHKSTADVTVFPTDYRLNNVLDLVLEMEIEVNGAGPVTMRVPISMDVQASVRYTIRVTVNTSNINVSFTRQNWQTGHDNGGDPSDVGSNETSVNLGTFIIENWGDGGSGNETFG